MELTGRLTADAVVTTVADKQVVNFRIADNESYKPKGATTYTQITTYFACAYWLSAKVAGVLLKGAIVTLKGRVGSKAYLTKKGEPASELTFHVDGVKVVQFAKKTEVASVVEQNPPHEDDLPF